MKQIDTELDNNTFQKQKQNELNQNELKLRKKTANRTH